MEQSRKKFFALSRVYNLFLYVSLINSFPMRKILKPPTSLSAATGELDGEVNLQWDSVDKANFYVIEYSMNRKNQFWKQADIVTVPHCTIAKLKPNVAYSFKVAASNGNEQSQWSEVVSKKLTTVS